MPVHTYVRIQYRYYGLLHGGGSQMASEVFHVRECWPFENHSNIIAEMLGSLSAGASLRNEQPLAI